MQLAQYKLELIDRILKINDKAVLKQLDKLLSQLSREKEEADDEEEFDAKKLTFEEWNAQFEDPQRDLDEYLPEYGMTLGEFRRMIYERERSENYVSFDDFFKEMDKW